MKTTVTRAPEAARRDVRSAVRGATMEGSAIIETAAMIRAATKNARRNKAHTIIHSVTIRAMIALRTIMRICAIGAHMKAALLRLRRRLRI